MTTIKPAPTVRFHAAHALLPQGWARDEEPGEIGKTLVFPPWFKDREGELREGLEQAEFA